jgi:TctA family transporter
VAGPESANNAGSQTSFIPMLTLGIPSNPVLALMIAAMMIQGIQPGPRVMDERPEVFWGLIASMWIGNAMLLVINLPMIPIWVRMLKIPYRFLFPTIVLLASIGVYSVANSTTEVLMMAAFGVLGYVLVRLRCEPAPLLLAFVLGPMMEEHFRRAMVITQGDATTFVSRPISLGLLLAAAALLALVVIPSFRKVTREAAAQDAI